MRYAISFVLCAAMVACGGSSPVKAPEDPTSTAAKSAGAAASAGPAVVAPSALTVVALKYTPPKKAGITTTTIDIGADGAIVGDGKSMGKVTSTGIVDGAGKAAVTVSADGTITIAGSDGKETLKFSPTDELLSQLEGGTVHTAMSVADDGTVSMNPGPTSVAAGKFEGMTKSAKREAILVVLALFASKAPPAPPSTVKHEH